jgi:hypothetical protein
MFCACASRLLSSYKKSLNHEVYERIPAETLKVIKSMLVIKRWSGRELAWVRREHVNWIDKEKMYKKNLHFITIYPILLTS